LLSLGYGCGLRASEVRTERHLRAGRIQEHARPRGMHRMTYHRVFAKAMAAQGCSLALAIDDIRRRYPGFLSEENVAESCFPPRSGPGS
jgi:hypothetical protein